ncbi:energy transducer TonB [Roseospira marina]|uniref:Protein TonB n=1 Tax=Roseospira marina TaxID=140057 RepID=A0A5M6I933_9PROT|nr:energy transducer TonB [Roseospira marina]KAA5604457.1 energy transducer TonB [Roseospira marina]MBB4315502.1 protein TonB [Roseospira marina]MBB5088561.1 protein TonB [Roseospira marina]
MRDDAALPRTQTDRPAPAVRSARPREIALAGLASVGIHGVLAAAVLLGSGSAPEPEPVGPPVFAVLLAGPPGGGGGAPEAAPETAPEPTPDTADEPAPETTEASAPDTAPASPPETDVDTTPEPEPEPEPQPQPEPIPDPKPEPEPQPEPEPPPPSPPPPRPAEPQRPAPSRTTPPPQTAPDRAPPTPVALRRTGPDTARSDRPATTATAGAQGALAAGSGDPHHPPGYTLGSARNPAPTYPQQARRLGQEGTVVLSVRVLPDGAADQVTITRSSGYGLLDRAAARTVEGWRFRPARRAGIPVSATARVTIRFVLR